MIQPFKILLLSIGILSSVSACQTVSKATSTVGAWVGLGDQSAKIPQVDKKGTVDMSKTTLEQAQQLALQMPRDQWVYLENDQQGIYQLQNKSQTGQILTFKLNCKIATQKSGFTLQDAEGKVLLKSQDATAGAIQFLLDNKNYGDPFAEINPQHLARFKTDLKKTKVIKIFNASKLYAFQNGKAEQLEKPISCL